MVIVLVPKHRVISPSSGSLQQFFLDQSGVLIFPSLLCFDGRGMLYCAHSNSALDIPLLDGTPFYNSATDRVSETGS